MSVQSTVPASQRADVELNVHRQLKGIKTLGTRLPTGAIRQAAFEHVNRHAALHGMPHTQHAMNDQDFAYGSVMLNSSFVRHARHIQPLHSEQDATHVLGTR